MKHEGPKQQSSSKPATTSGGQRGGARSAGADARAGHRYEGAAAARSTGLGATTATGAATPKPALPVSELHVAAQSLAATHGERLGQSAERLGVPGPHLAAVVLAEGQYLPRAVAGAAEAMPIRFEPYTFFRETGRWLAATHRDQVAEQRVFEQARALNDDAAHRALRMGLGQVSGAEHAAAGFESPQAMRQALSSDPAAQLSAMTAVVAASEPLRAAIGEGNWSEVAQMRAGPGFGALGYDLALAASAQAYKQAIKPGGDDDGDDKPTKKPRKKA